MISRERLLRFFRPPGLYKFALVLFSSLFVTAFATSCKFIREICLFGVIAVATGLTLRSIVVAAQRFVLLPKRVGELLATVIFVAAGSTVAVNYFPPHSIESYVGLAASFVWAFAGAAWAWNRNRILKVQNANTRIFLFVLGWVGVAGCIGAVVFTVSIFLVMKKLTTKHDFTPTEQQLWLATLTYSSIAMPFSIPLIMIEWKIRSLDSRLGV